MANADERLEEAYSSLCQVLRRPQDFGLVAGVPRPLANVLEETLAVLAETMRQNRQPLAIADEYLEAELSQDADVPACRRY